MRQNRLKLIRLVAVIVILGLVIFSPLLALQPQETASNKTDAPPQTARVAAIDRPRPEFRIEGIPKLGEFTGFDTAIASILNDSPQKRSGDELAAAGENARAPEQIASLSTKQRERDVAR